MVVLRETQMTIKEVVEDLQKTLVVLRETQMTIKEVVEDLQILIDKGYGDNVVKIYHLQVQESYDYIGASIDGLVCYITIED